MGLGTHLNETLRIPLKSSWSATLYIGFIYIDREDTTSSVLTLLVLIDGEKDRTIPTLTVHIHSSIKITITAIGISIPEYFFTYILVADNLEGNTHNAIESCTQIHISVR